MMSFGGGEEDRRGEVTRLDGIGRRETGPARLRQDDKMQHAITRCKELVRSNSVSRSTRRGAQLDHLYSLVLRFSRALTLEKMPFTQSLHQPFPQQRHAPGQAATFRTSDPRGLLLSPHIRRRWKG